MSTKSKKSTTKSPLDLAAEHVKEVEKSIQLLADQIEPLRSEREQLSQKLLLSPEDVDRLADLEDGSLPRREEYLEHLKDQTLPDALAALRREELLELAGAGIESIAGRREALDKSIADAEQRIADAVADARREVEEWNAYLNPILAAAKEAGQDDRNPADPDHPVTVSLDSMDRPGRERPGSINVEGVRYRPSGVNQTAQRAAAKADAHLAELIRLGAEELTNSEVRRGRWR